MLTEAIACLLEEADRRENIVKTTDYSEEACRDHWLQYHKTRGQSPEDHREFFMGCREDHQEFAAALREVCAAAEDKNND